MVLSGWSGLGGPRVEPTIGRLGSAGAAPMCDFHTALGLLTRA
jgi:hypothetical protein